MRRPGEPAGPITRSIGRIRETVAWLYALTPAGFISAYYLGGGK